ncbi:MAG: hypothetical protein AB7I36_20590 [Rhodospirillaceae bacterium]
MRRDPSHFDPPGPTVTRFLHSTARRRVIMGPFGSGKSVACCTEIMRRAREQAPSMDGVRRTRWAVVRNTYPDLKNTTVKTWSDWWDDEFGTVSRVAPFVHHLKFPLDDGTRADCEVIFLALDDEADAKKFLSLELTGIYFNELRELKRAVVEAGDGRLGRYPAMKDGGPSWYGMIADTNMPNEDHWLYALAEESEGKEGWAFFRQPAGVIKVDGPSGAQWVQNPRAENLKNLTPGYYTGQLAGKSDAWIAVHLAAEYGRLPVEGAYFAEELTASERAGRICELSASPDLPVHTFWDIGVSDYMSIWCGQAVGDEWNFIHFYENTGRAIDHYVAYLQEQAARARWTFGDHVWPHDGAHRDVGILGAKSRAEVFASLGLKAPIILPRRASPGDWIDATRLFLRKCRFNAGECRTGLVHLRKYKKRRDAVRNVYLNEPFHDEHSHAADAFQVAAMGRGRVSNASAVWTDEIVNFRIEGLP